MTDTDRLSEIKVAREKYKRTHYGDKLTTKQIDWLISEVERLREFEAGAYPKNQMTMIEMEREIARLQVEMSDLQRRQARDLKEALSQHKAECG